MSLQGSKNAMSLAQMSVKLMLKGVHWNANTVGMTMAQRSMKASSNRWSVDAKLAITNKREQVLEYHIFEERKRGRKNKARKVIGSNKQRIYITKEDMISPTVSTEAIDAQERGKWQ